MEAKLKAKELVDKFMQIEIEIGSKYDGYLTMKLHEAKQCAIICCDEIINSRPAITQSQVDYIEYWQSVKTEIPNLEL